MSFTAASAELGEKSEVMGQLVQQFGPARYGPKPKTAERFEVLCRSIAFQQLAGKAAGAIWGRARALTPEWAPGPVLAIGEEPLRAAGLSGSKTRAVLDLAAHCEQGLLNLAGLGRLPDEEVIKQLSRVYGIGVWTAQMFLISSLHRFDVWPVGDLGVRRGFQLSHGMAEMPTPVELELLGDVYRPYRSVAAWYCWRVADGDL